MKQFARYAAMCAVLALVSACVDLEQNFAFREDGTAEVQMRLAIAANILAMTQGGGSEFCNIGSDTVMSGVEMSSRAFADRGDMVCEISAATTLAELIERVGPGFMMPVPGGGMSTDTPSITLVEIPDGYRFAVAWTSPGASAAEEPGAALGSQFALAASAGRSLGWTVTAPRILSTTGQLSEDGRTVSFFVPLASALTGEPETHTFEVVFSTRGEGPLDWLFSLFGGT